ncbi:MAG: DUF4345 domain-containing protein [Salinisphaeraceae bacterium]|nr:DUF4345 domain-containing protein [Salinisphaeraceae bacterium]
MIALFLFFTGLVFIGVGIFGVMSPEALLAPVALKIENLSSMNQMRASAGGVPLLTGLFMCYAAFRKSLKIPALWLVTILLGGLTLGRIISMVVDGMPPSVNLWFMAAEVFGLVQAVFWLRVAQEFEAD